MGIQFLSVIQQLSMTRRRFLVIVGESVLVIGLRKARPVGAISPQQQSTVIGYGQGSYGEGQYPAPVEYDVYMPLVTKERK